MQQKHSTIHFFTLFPPKREKENRDGYQSVLSARGRWRAKRAPAGLITLSVSEAWVPVSEDEERTGVGGD